MAAQLESRGRDASRLVADLSGSILEQYPKLREFREAAPEYVTDEDLLREWQRCGNNKAAMSAKVTAWWNDLPDNRAVQGQSTSWEQVTHKKKSNDELSDKMNDMSLRDRKNRGRSAPPTRGGRGGGRGGGRASSVGGGRGGRGAPRGPRQAAGESTTQQGAPATIVEQVDAPTEPEQTTAAAAAQTQEAPATQESAPASAPPAAPAAPVAPTPTYSTWNGQVSFADMVKKQSAPVAAQPQQVTEAPAAQLVEPQQPHVNGDATHQVVEDTNANTKQTSTRGRGGRGRSTRGEARAYRPKVTETAPLSEQLPLDNEQQQPVSVEQNVHVAVDPAHTSYDPKSEVAEQQKEGYLNMGKWEVGGASPEVGSFQFGSFGGSADFESAVPEAWGASDQLGGNGWEVEGDGRALEQAQDSNAAVNSLFDSSAQETQLHQSERRTTQPPGFDTADTNAPPGLDGLHSAKHDPPGSRRGHQGGRHYQNQRGSQHQHQHQQQPQQQGVPQQQPMAYGHPYGLGMGMGEAPGGYMPYMPAGFGGAVSSPATTAASTSSTTASGTTAGSGAPGMAHVQQPYGAPQPGYSPYYFYPPMYYQQPAGHYYGRGSQGMYQAPRGPYMSYEQPTTAPMYGQYENMYGMHGVPHDAPAPGGKGTSGSKGGSSTATQHHAPAAPTPDMGLNPSTSHGSYPFYGSREPQPWYNPQQSWGHGGAAPYPQSPQTGGSAGGAGFPQARK